MNIKTLISVENFCRTCINGNEEVDKEIAGRKPKYISIFDKAKVVKCKQITIMELLMLTTPELNIESGDLLPKTLCENCFNRLIKVYKFQQMCIRVQQKLRQMITVDNAANNDPLHDSLIDISVKDEQVSQAINDLTYIAKIEMDEPLLDQDETISNNRSIQETKALSTEVQWDDANDSEMDDTNNSESEWEKETFNKRKTFKKHVKKLKEKRDTNSTTKKEEPTSEVNGYKKSANNAKESEKHKFICNVCGKRLSSRNTLNRHKRLHIKHVEGNTLANTRLKCNFCHKVFPQSSSLQNHLRTHTGEQPFLCSECGKSFKCFSNMQQHFLRHGTDRPYSCPDCPKSFRCASDLSSHKAVHNKTKSHVCDVCGAAFMHPYLLKKHNLYHTGERNHKCNYCDMKFFLIDHCRRHMRTHTGEKPYKCKYCDRAFAQSNDLIKHLRGHLGDNVYKCDLCPKGFRLQGDLRSHFKTHKNEDEGTRTQNLQALKDEEHRLQIKFGLIKST